jgi:hypothetical protein
LLDPEATAIADGGGLATTFLRPIDGGEQIACAWVEIANRSLSDLTFLERTVNGQPGLVAQQDGVTVTVFAFEVAGDRIKHIWAIRNPEKLRLSAARYDLAAREGGTERARTMLSQPGLLPPDAA